MAVWEFSLLTFVCSLIAGLVGALTGLGGVVLAPLLTAAFVKEGFSNISIAMLPEIATTIGALSGATLAAHVSTRAIAIDGGVLHDTLTLRGRGDHSIRALIADRYSRSSGCILPGFCGGERLHVYLVHTSRALGSALQHFLVG